MPLNANTTARDAGFQNVQYYRKRIQYTDGVLTWKFKIPAGAIILAPLSGVDVQTVFNFGTNNRVQIGDASNASKYGLNVSLAALGFAPPEERGEVSMEAREGVSDPIQVGRGHQSNLLVVANRRHTRHYTKPSL